jgi:hypothetical protein
VSVSASAPISGSRPTRWRSESCTISNARFELPPEFQADRIDNTPINPRSDEVVQSIS